MRRGINNRKKKKILLKEINLKSLKLILILAIILTICFVIYLFFIQNLYIKKNLEEETLEFSALNENIPFHIKKIILFSSATAESTTVNQSIANLNISQYCDIGIYLNKLNKEDVSISSLYIDNIFISSTELGTPYLYRKKVPDLGKCSFSEDDIINDRFEFNIVNHSEELSYDNYELYNNLSAPISLGFYNKNVKTNFLSDNSSILYNGTLLKNSLVPLSSLNCSIEFRINIITNSEEHYICNINFNIPLKNEETSIYDTGYVIKEFNTEETNNFIRIR